MLSFKDFGQFGFAKSPFNKYLSADLESSSILFLSIAGCAAAASLTCLCSSPTRISIISKLVSEF